MVALGLAVVPGAVARRAKPTPCADGRFLLSPGTAVVVGAQTIDAVTIDGGRATIESACDAATARIRARRKATKVSSTWDTCGTASRVKLRASIAAPDCDHLTGTLKAKGAKATRFEATRDAGGGGSTTTTTTTILGPQLHGLDAIYKIRDDIMAPTARGQHYIDLVNTYNTTMIAWLMHGDGLYDVGAPALLAWMPAFEALANGRGGTVTITAEQVAGLESFFSLFSTFVGPEVAAVIADELAAVPPASLIGKTMDEARDIVLSVPVTNAADHPILPRGGGCGVTCLATGMCNY